MNLKVIIPKKWNPNNPKAINTWFKKLSKY
jgi:hypothetical protein